MNSDQLWCCKVILEASHLSLAKTALKKDAKNFRETKDLSIFPWAIMEEFEIDEDGITMKLVDIFDGRPLKNRKILFSEIKAREENKIIASR